MENDKQPDIHDDIHDCPDSMGALYAQRKALQFANVEWTPILEVPTHSGTFAAGTTVKGLPYSSVREADKFIGFDISLETFMTALQNPASVIYTRNLRDANDPDHNSGNTNCTTYYGVVCSTFVGYVLGIDMRYTTCHWNEMEGMHAISEQTAYGLKIGDSLCTPPGGEGHVIFIYDIVRTRMGRIKYIEVIESTRPVVKKTRYSSDQFMSFIKKGRYMIYRYDKIVDNSYCASDYVAVDGEVATTAAVNTVLSLDYGDKANYRKGDRVSINIMDSAAVSLVIQKRGNADETWETQSTIVISGVSETIINGSAYTIYTFAPDDDGDYQAYCVMSDGSSSRVVLWQVASVSATATNVAARNGDVTVTFKGSDNATPLYLSWNNDHGVSYKNQSLTEAERFSATAITSFNQTGTWYVKVYFQTTFGRLAATTQAVTIT